MAPIRMGRLAALGLATGLLMVGAWVAQDGLAQMRYQQRLLSQSQQRLQAAQALAPEIERREGYVRQMSQMTEQVNHSGLDPTQWGERRLRRVLHPTPRVDVARFLDDLAHAGSRNLLVADYFELATVSKGAGLFHPPVAGDEGLALGITATQYFRSDKVSP